MSGFQGFGPQALPFLKGLAFHQNRDWFEENRAVFEANAKQPMLDLVAALSARFEEDGIPLRGDPKASMFRIHRDIRFSKDKSPYKTHIGATLTRSGQKNDPGGLLYIHIDPNGCFAAAGFYMPEPADLLKLRTAIRDDIKGWQKVESALAKKDLRLGEGEMNARLPQGFEAAKGTPIADVLRRKSFIVERPLPDADLGSPALVDRIVAFATAARPLLNFGAKALGRA